MKFLCRKVGIEWIKFSMFADLEQQNIELAHISGKSNGKTNSDSEFEHSLKKLGQLENRNR
jgi:hypothetical protein